MALKQGSRQSPTQAPAKSPAPTLSRNTGGIGLGQGHYSGASSVNPGDPIPQTILGANIRSSVDDPAMARVIASGTKLDTSVTSQLRSIAAGNVKTNPGTLGPRKT